MAMTFEASHCTSTLLFTFIYISHGKLLSLGNYRTTIIANKRKDEDKQSYLGSIKCHE